MDIDVAENISVEGNFTDEAEIYVHYVDWRERLFLETFTIVCLLNLVTSVFVCYAIMRFKKLRSQVPNLYLFHWHLIASIYYISTPNLFRLMIEGVEFKFSGQVYVVVMEMQASLLFCLMIFVAIMASDSVLHAHWPERSRKFRRHHKFTTIMVYIVFVMFVGLIIGNGYLLQFIPISHMAVFLGYIALIVVAIVLNLIHLVKKRKNGGISVNSTLGLKLANIFVACWLPSFLSLSVSFFVHHHPFFAVFAGYLGFCHPLANVLILYMSDRYFKACFLQIFRCSSGKYAEDMENLDEEVDEENVAVRYDPNGGAGLTNK